MKTLALFLLALIIFRTGKAQDTTKIRQFYSKDFNWRITMPENFDTVSSEAWAKVKNRGSAAVEKTYNHKIEDKTHNIFVFSSGQSNYFEALYQSFDPKKDGTYLQLNKNIDGMIYHTLATQIPGAVIDSASTKAIIGSLSFDAFVLRATLPNGITFSIYSFSRLFGDKDFTVNIIFLDTNKGDIMLNAWKKSTFGKVN